MKHTKRCGTQTSGGGGGTGHFAIHREKKCETDRGKREKEKMTYRDRE